MRVCPKCGFIDPPEWKHTKYSYHIDNISFENFKRLYPELAKNLKKGGDITEDNDYYYRLVKTELWVSRKAKIEWTEKNPFGAEKYEKFDHKFLKDVHDYRKYWNSVHPDQSKLIVSSDNRNMTQGTVNNPDGSTWQSVSSKRQREQTKMKFEEDFTHCHCIDCGKLYPSNRDHELCDNCGGLIDWCDGRCNKPKVKKHFEELGIRWEVYSVPNKDICPACDGEGVRVLGEGETRGTCPQCNGTGRVRNKNMRKKS